MVFLDKVKQHLLDETTDIFNILGATSLRRKLDILKKEEREAAARLGYEVLSRGDANKYGEDGAAILHIQEKISAMQKRLIEEERHLKYE